MQTMQDKAQSRQSSERNENGKDIGLGFSGGGIRSSLICMGFLHQLSKASQTTTEFKDSNGDAKSKLEEQKKDTFFQNLAAVSSVSGGGYTSGALLSWLKFTQKKKDPLRKEEKDDPLRKEEKDDPLRKKVSDMCQSFITNKENTNSYSPSYLTISSQVALGAFFFWRVLLLASQVLFFGTFLGFLIKEGKYDCNVDTSNCDCTLQNSNQTAISYACIPKSNWLSQDLQTNYQAVTEMERILIYVVLSISALYLLYGTGLVVWGSFSSKLCSKSQTEWSSEDRKQQLLPNLKQLRSVGKTADVPYRCSIAVIELVLIFGVGYVFLHLLWIFHVPNTKSDVPTDTTVLEYTFPVAAVGIITLAIQYTKFVAPSLVSISRFPMVFEVVSTACLMAVLSFFVAFVAWTYIDHGLTRNYVFVVALGIQAFRVWWLMVSAVGFRCLRKVTKRCCEMKFFGRSQRFSFVNVLYSENLADYYFIRNYSLNDLTGANFEPPIDFHFNCHAELNNAYGAEWQDFCYTFSSNDGVTFGGPAFNLDNQNDSDLLLGGKNGMKPFNELEAKYVKLSEPVSLSAGAAAPTLGTISRPFDSFALRFVLCLLDINMGGYIRWSTNKNWDCKKDFIVSMISFVLNSLILGGYSVFFVAVACERFHFTCPKYLNDAAVVGIPVSFAALLFGIGLEACLGCIARQACCRRGCNCCFAHMNRFHIADHSFLHVSFNMLFRFPVKNTSRFILVADGGHFENLGGLQLLLKRYSTIVLVDGAQDNNIKMESLTRLLHLAQDRCWIKSFKFQTPPYDLKMGQRPLDFAKSRVLKILVTYPEPKKTGTVYYIKSNLMSQHHTNHEREYNLHMEHISNDAFPHDSTGNQFFDSQKWRSYMDVGRCAAKNFLAEWSVDVV